MLRSLYLTICLCCLSPLTAKTLEVSVQADSAIVMNAETGAILYQKNARKLQVPASITKIATAMYSLKVRGDKLDTMIAAEHDAIASISQEERRRSNYTLPAYWLEPGTSHIGIKRGEELSLEDLLYGIMIASAGDASNVVAQYIGGSIPTFMDMLNDYLKEVGCKDTTFKNPHGLYHPQHLTTAYDMAILTREALKDSTFREIVKTVSYMRPKTNKQNPTTLIQTNSLLKRGKNYYSKAIGVKTGYVSAAKNTFVAAAKDKDRTLIVVLLKCEDRDLMFRDAKKVFETAFKEKKVRRTLLTAGPQKATLSLEGASSVIKTVLNEDVTFDYFPAEEPKIKCLLYWDQVNLPVEKGQRVGRMSFEDQEGRELLTQPLFALKDVGYGWLYRMKSLFGVSTLLKILGGVFLFLLGGFVFSVRK